MAVSNTEIDVKKIMEEIRADIQNKKILEDIPSFEDIPIQSSNNIKQKINVSTSDENYYKHYMENLDYLNRNVEMLYYFELGTSPVKKFVKRVIRKTLKFLLYPITQQQTTFNEHVVRCLNAVRDYMSDMKQKNENDMADIKQQYEKEKEEVRKLAKQTEELKMEFLKLHEKEKEEVKKLAKQTEELKMEFLKLQMQGENFEKMISSHIDEVQKKFIAMDQEVDAISAGMAKIVVDNLLHKSIECEQADEEKTHHETSKNEDDSYIAIDYFAFQNAFRGTRTTIRQRQSIYLPYFESERDLPVLDIGCGRGEFLQLLKEKKIPAFGIDLYSEYVVEGALHDLDIRQGDGIAFLQNTDLKFGGIMVSQVVEHISFEQLQILCKAAYEKLQQNAYLVIETPNPMSVSVFTNSFYLDPTHQRPVHPFMLQYLLKEIGFSDVQIVFTEASRMEGLPKIKSDSIDNLEELNAGIQRVSDMLFGSQDYAVIAKK